MSGSAILKTVQQLASITHVLKIPALTLITPKTATAANASAVYSTAQTACSFGTIRAHAINSQANAQWAGKISLKYSIKKEPPTCLMQIGGIQIH